jgi:hypothetical protein
MYALAVRTCEAESYLHYSRVLCTVFRLFPVSSIRDTVRGTEGKREGGYCVKGRERRALLFLGFRMGG